MDTLFVQKDVKAETSGIFPVYCRTATALTYVELQIERAARTGCTVYSCRVTGRGNLRESTGFKGFCEASRFKGMGSMHSTYGYRRVHLDLSCRSLHVVHTTIAGKPAGAWLCTEHSRSKSQKPRARTPIYNHTSHTSRRRFLSEMPSMSTLRHIRLVSRGTVQIPRAHGDYTNGHPSSPRMRLCFHSIWAS